eukprot:CAMPEP_0115007950 /NCGR_PEP_ID=MMETSP0216-20121206/21576_1 /TAXON_ID=223996 /ORGANISM="Protocruzia adherens, Strain Boccale" /LENGTH=289 /DNA_ID=CAMNT_0002375173 /DNA_START=25 /DNA_END=894 /DNA_ORIENTATION=-
MVTSTGNSQCPPGYYYFETTLGTSEALAKPYNTTAFDYASNEQYVSQSDLKRVMDKLQELKTPYRDSMRTIQKASKAFCGVMCTLMISMMVLIPVTTMSTSAGDGPHPIIFIIPALFLVSMIAFSCCFKRLRSSAAGEMEKYDSACDAYLREQNTGFNRKNVNWSHHLTTQLTIGTKGRARQRRVSYIQLSTPVSIQNVTMNPAFQMQAQMMQQNQMVMMQNPAMMSQMVMNNQTGSVQGAGNPGAGTGVQMTSAVGTANTGSSSGYSAMTYGNGQYNGGAGGSSTTHV